MTAGGYGGAAFLSALPVWPAGLAHDMNCTAGFRCVLPADPGSRTILRVTASSLYRAFVNGDFLGHGPARGPHGYARIDEWDLTGRLRPGRNLIALEVASYNVNSYYLLDQPGFLQAEIIIGGAVAAATGVEGGGFVALLPPERVKRVERYSVARTFSEVYHLASGSGAWRRDAHAAFVPVHCEICPSLKLLPRGVGYPGFAMHRPVTLCAKGTFGRKTPPVEIERDWTLTMIGPQLRGFPEQELESIPSFEYQFYERKSLESANEPWGSQRILDARTGHFQIVDLGKNCSGFVGFRIRAPRPLRLLVAFDEILREGDVDPRRLRCVNLFLLECEPGLLSFESFEPYTMRYLKFMGLDGGGNVEDIYLREYCNPDTGRSLFAPDDTSLRAIFEAARETLRQNAVDLLTDCPSRERAGWLCDSFFSARAAWLLTGSTSVEHNFLENYLLPERFEHLPEGMLPMCYPADHDLGNFIPNWALWFILQVEEYLERSGDVSMVAQLRNRVQAVLWYLENFENDSGLLENLESWVFVEWSQANEFTEGVHYPTNMLYGAALSAAGRLYSSPDLVQKGYRIRETVRLQSFDGRWFVDNAVREEGKLRLTENRSEICQAYALYFDVVTPNGEAAFWDLFVRDLGPRGRKSNLHPEIARANALNGYILRLELLARHGLHRQCLEEMRELYEPMVCATGTLWEHVEPTASCCHGFQSFVACLLFESARALALPSLAGGS